VLLIGLLLAAPGCGRGRTAEASRRPELPVSATALITTSTTTASTSTTTAPPTTAPPPTTTASPPRPARALIIADSVLLAARAALPASLPGWTVTVDATENRRMGAFTGTLAARGGPSPYRVVAIHLCTNYARGEGFGRALDRAMAALASVPRVVWVTCVEWSEGPPEANQIIRAAANRYGNVAVADWAVISGTPGYTYDDGIHLRPAGQRAAAALVAAAVGPP
jgi:hypothetical protein